jgi:membrane protease YdiL (CAAX protease family)
MKDVRNWMAVVWLLLGAAWRRGGARLARARRNGDHSSIAFLFAVLGALAMQIMFGFSFLVFARTTSEVELEAGAQLMIPDYAYEEMLDEQRSRSETGVESAEPTDQSMSRSLQWQLSALRLQGRRGGSEADWLHEIERRYRDEGSKAFVPEPEGAWLDFYGNAAPRALALLIALGLLSLALQGEGMVMDTQRRRHPMWEWYLGYPIPQSAVFVAEALAPVVSNPMLFTAPLLLAAIAGFHADSALVALCALPVAIPLVLVAAVYAKVFEVLIMLRSSARNRSSWLLLIGGLGFLFMFLPMLLMNSRSSGYWIAAQLMPVFNILPSASVLIETSTVSGWLHAMATSSLIAMGLLLPAIVVLRFATARGLESGFGDTAAPVTEALQRGNKGISRWLRDPILRKDWLWLKRDRGALLQLIGIPLVLVLFQGFNLRNVMTHADLNWHRLAGVVVGLGAYMLFASGPRALMSERPALMLTMSWPRALEDTLRAKVRLILVLVTAIVWCCLAIIAWMFPADTLYLLLVAIVWPLFALSISEKAVTLIQTPASSGEPEPLPRVQVMAAALGNLTFAIGLYTAQWHLAIAAIVFNWVFAGALWQGFRVRLEYLFDPESRPAIRPPTVLGSLIAVVALLEIGTIFNLLFQLMLDKGAEPYAQVLGYGVAATLVSGVVWWQYSLKGVHLGEIFRIDDHTTWAPVAGCLLALLVGAALGVLALGYQHWLASLPWSELSEAIQRSAKHFDASTQARRSYAIMAVAIAPWVEEFLFRGLMFRAMWSEWGMTRALLMSSFFFAALHPMLAWPMVFALGACSAILFARTRTLLPCILMHVCYNAIVVWGSF